MPWNVLLLITICTVLCLCLCDERLIKSRNFKRSIWTKSGSKIRQENYTVCWLLEDDSFYSSYQRLVAAVDLAISHANAYVLPNGINLQLIYQNAGPSCSDLQHAVTVNVLKLLQTGVSCDVFLGIGCPSTAVALYGIASHLDVLILGCPAAGTGSLALNAARDDSFPLLIRPSFGFADVAHFLNVFLQQNHYVHLSILRDDSYSFYTFLAQFIMVKLRKSNPPLFANTMVYPFFSNLSLHDSLKQLVQTAHDATRVMLLLAHADAVRQLMIGAAKLGFTDGEYLFLAVELFDLNYWGSIHFDRGDIFDDVARQAFRSLMVMSLHKVTANPEVIAFEERVKHVSRSRYNHTFRPLEKLDPIIFAHYESILMYAQEVSSMLADGYNQISGSVMLRRLTESQYAGIAGPMRISKDGERHNNLELRTFNAKTGEFDATFEYIQVNFSTEIFRYVKNLTWPSVDGQLPADEPMCGFRGEKCVDKTLPTAILTFGVVIPLLVVLGLGAAGVVTFLKFRKLREEYNPNWWRISLDELTIKSDRSKTTANGTHSYTTMNQTQTNPSIQGSVGRHSSKMYVTDKQAIYKGGQVALTDVDTANRHPSADMINRLIILKAINCPNLQKFVGLSLNALGVVQFVVNEYCMKGTLGGVLDNEMIKLDWSFKNSLIKDIVCGMAYLHDTAVKSHGDLNTRSCRIDAKFTLKIGDYGLPYFRDPDTLKAARPKDEPDRSYEPLLWRSPELLRQTMPPEGTQKGDVYSFAIILQQLILRSGPFELPSDPLDLSHREIIQEVMGSNIPPTRPRVPRAACSNQLYELMERCWEEVPLGRPNFAKIKEQLKRIIGDVGDNIVDVLFKRMEQYALDLEQKVEEKTQQFMEEKFRSEQLLSQLLPRTVAAALTRGEHVDPEAYESVTIFFSDIVGFTAISAAGSPMDVISLLNNLYTFFDGVLERHDVYKVETIGDAYMVASGLPVRNGNRHASEIANMALSLLNGIKMFVVPNQPEVNLKIRIGINTGPCVAGIVGLKMPRYCVFGDTVNVASRMESTGEPMKIQTTKVTCQLLQSVGGFHLSERGAVSIKGKGTLTTFWLINTDCTFDVYPS